MKKLFGKKGFTLIELVIVIVLISILAAVAYPKYIDLRNDAHKSADLATISALRAGVHIYFAKHHEFPQDAATLEDCLEEGLPDGWTTATNADGTITITCNGLPSDGTTHSWTYDPTDGSITMVGDGSAHGF